MPVVISVEVSEYGDGSEGPSVSFPVGGKQLDDYMISLLGEKGILLNTQTEKELATEIKENLGRVSLNFET